MRFLFILMLAGGLSGAAPDTMPEVFLYGASTYPELQTRAEWNQMLDIFQKAHFKLVRVSESSWGNLETAPGKYDFAWLRQYLDDVQKHGMKAMLGTSSYLPPQWLAAKHPEILFRYESGATVHPMGRKGPCLHHPLYREALRRYILALGREFKDHPAVIGWQLDNEIELLPQICYNPECERAWREWLKKTYRTSEELNRRLGLTGWGLSVDSIDDVPQPRATIDGSLPALRLAHLRFQRDTVMDFFREQAQTLREAGVKQWITTDWNDVWNALADDPRAKESLDLAGINFYQPSADNPAYFRNLAWHLDMNRSAHGLGRFLVTETRVGVAGDVTMWDAFPTRDQWRMWMLQPTAYGAMGLMFWSGNRWTGGHWPQWGGVLDWTGQPEPDFPWLIELGAFYEKWGSALLNFPVKARAAVITDYEQRAALSIYKHTPSSNQVLPLVFDALHRLGIAADAVSVAAASSGKLGAYSLAVLAADPALSDPGLVPALRRFVENGGNIVVTPFTDYQTRDGVFRSDGFGAGLAPLTGAIARSVRRMGAPADGRESQRVSWLGGVSPVGIDGFIELLDPRPDAEVTGRFVSTEAVLDGRPAALRKHSGKGSVTKLAFWPADDSILRLFRDLAGDEGRALTAALPAGLQAVPRSDGSVFVINTGPKSASIQLKRAMTDRITGRKVDSSATLKGYEVLWLE